MFALPEIPAKAEAATIAKITAIERIFFHYFLIDKEREAICLYVERRCRNQK